MPIKILLRTQANVNIFRDLIIQTSSSSIGDSLVICSGFFQEGRRNYFASYENNFRSGLRHSGKYVTTICVHNSGWAREYKAFIASLRAVGIPVKGRLCNKFHWHAKIYLVLDQQKPIFGIIGSSNITRPAFSDTTPFNFEADVVLWVDGIPVFDNIVENALSKIEQQNYFSVRYSPEENRNMTIDKRLQYLYSRLDNEKYREI